MDLQGGTAGAQMQFSPTRPPLLAMDKSRPFLKPHPLFGMLGYLRTRLRAVFGT